MTASRQNDAAPDSLSFLSERECVGVKREGGCGERALTLLYFVDNECLSTRSSSRSGIATSRSGTALAPPPLPPCSPAEGLIACGDGSGSGATQTAFKCGRSAHIMDLWLPAASISCRLACISQCFGGWIAGLYAARRRDSGVLGTSLVVKDTFQSQ